MTGRDTRGGPARPINYSRGAVAGQERERVTGHSDLTLAVRSVMLTRGGATRCGSASRSDVGANL